MVTWCNADVTWGNVIIIGHSVVNHVTVAVVQFIRSLILYSLPERTALSYLSSPSVRLTLSDIDAERCGAPQAAQCRMPENAILWFGPRYGFEKKWEVSDSRSG